MSQSPELAGGDGFTFEGSVAAFYLTSLLMEGDAPGINGIVYRVAFQQRAFDEPLDDIIIDVRRGEARLSLQVKRSLVISKAISNTDFSEIIRDCWITFNKNDFRHGADCIGAAVGVGVAKARALRTLCEIARASNNTKHFDARFSPKGNASKEVKKIKNDIETLLNKFNDSQCTKEQLHQFLAHFVLIEFDFLHAGAKDTPQAINNIRRCLISSDAAKAPLVWSRLLELARASAGKSGEFTRASLVRSIAHVAQLSGANSLSADLEKLRELAKSYTESIQDDIGGTQLDRVSLSAELDSKLATSRLIQICGLPGSGKSVLLRQSVQRAINNGSVLFLKGDQLEGCSWISFANAHGLSSVTLHDLLIEIAATGSAIFYIDAIDRIEKKHQPIVFDILQTITKSSLLDNWRIVASLRNTGIEPLRNWMGELLNLLGLATVEVDILDDESSTILAESKPHLRGLLFGPEQVRKIVRRPFFAKVLNESFVTKTSCHSFLPQSEVELIENWWSRGGYNAIGHNVIERQRAIVELGEARARDLSQPISVKKLTSTDAGLIDQFVTDGILQYVRCGHTIRFSHDIFFEWAFFHTLIDCGENWREGIRACGEPPAVARVVELLSQWEYAQGQDWSRHLMRTKSSGMRSQWTRAWLLGPLGAADFLSNKEQYTQAVFADDFNFLRKALVWFQAEKITPNPIILARDLPQDQQLRFADLVGWPSDFSAWGRFISFLLHCLSGIPVSLYPDVFSVFEVWQNALFDRRNTLSYSILTQCVEWLHNIEVGLSLVEKPDANTARWKDIRNLVEFHKSILRLILRASRSEPAFAEEYLRRVISSEDKENQFEDIVAFSPVLVQYHSLQLVELTLNYLRKDLPDDRVARKKAEATSSFTGFGFRQFSYHDFQTLSINLDGRNFSSPSPLREPFYSLFQSSPADALRLLRELCNHAMTAWRQLHHYIPDKRGTPIPLKLTFPWGIQEFSGGDREYLWFQGFQRAPRPLVCGFMALEDWCFFELERGHPVDELIQQIVEGNECIGILCIAVMLALHNEIVSEVVFPLVTSQRLLSADYQRVHAELSGVNWLDHFHNSAADNTAIQSANQRKVRKKELKCLIPHYIFKGQHFSERTRAAVLDFKNHLPFQFEEECNNAKIRDDLIEQASQYAELVDLNNYHAYKLKEEDQFLIEHVSPSASTPERIAEIRESHLWLQKRQLHVWAFSTFKTGVLDGALTVSVAIAIAKQFDIEHLFEQCANKEDLAMCRGAVAATAAIVLNFRQDTSQVDLLWARDVLKRASLAPEERDIMQMYSSVISWHHAIFVARGLAADLRENTAEKNTGIELLKLVTHPLEIVSLTALEEACQLWMKDARLSWAAMLIAFSLCHIQPKPPGQPVKLYGPLHSSEEIRMALDVAEEFYRKEEGWCILSLPPPAWVKLECENACGYSNNDFDEDDKSKPNDAWVEPVTEWLSQYAAKILPLLSLEGILTSDAKSCFLDFISNILIWTNQKNEPPWQKSGRRSNVNANLFEWTRQLGYTLGKMSGLLTLEEIQSRFLKPIFTLEDASCWKLLEPFTSTYVSTYIYDAQTIPNDAINILDLCLNRLLESPAFRCDLDRSGEFYDPGQRRLIQTLMFISAEHATLALRYVNGDWSEIECIFPLIDRFVRVGGWSAPVMEPFLTLCERAKTSYPVEKFADQILAIINDDLEKLKGWYGKDIPARIAGLVQYFTDRVSPMPPELSQKFLQILDLLVDMGDRRSAALQFSQAFREVRVAGSTHV